MAKSQFKTKQTELEISEKKIVNYLILLDKMDETILVSAAIL